MKATRRLDTLAAIGGLIAVVLVVYQIVVLNTARDPERLLERTGEAIIARLLASDVRADFEASRPFDFTDQDAAGAIERLEQAIQKYPDSARLHFRLGTLDQMAAEVYAISKGKTPSPDILDDPRANAAGRGDALRRAAELDTENALPLYLLASDAASRQAWDESLGLLAEANLRDRVDSYPIPYDVCENNLLREIVVVAAHARQRFPTLNDLRKLTSSLAEHASDLHAAGRTDEALAILGDLRQMGWKMIRADGSQLIDLLVGIAMVSIVESHEEEIYADTGWQAGLAAIEQEKEELIYLRAGGRAAADLGHKEFAHGIARAAAPPVSVAPILLQAWLAVVLLTTWGVLALIAGKRQASAVHAQATEHALPTARLTKLYALVFLPLGVAAAALVYVLVAQGVPLLHWIPVGVAAVVPSVALLWLSIAGYRRAHRQAAETAMHESIAFWRKAPTEEKREVARRLAGIHGGAMVFLAAWLLVLTVGMKLAVGGVPWQPKSPAGSLQWETKYVRGLVDGEIKVPEKYIREVREDQREAEQRRSQFHQPESQQE